MGHLILHAYFQCPFQTTHLRIETSPPFSFCCCSKTTILHPSQVTTHYSMTNLHLILSFHFLLSSFSSPLHPFHSSPAFQLIYSFESSILSATHLHLLLQPLFGCSITRCLPFSYASSFLFCSPTYSHSILRKIHIQKAIWCQTISPLILFNLSGFSFPAQPLSLFCF